MTLNYYPLLFLVHLGELRFSLASTYSLLCSGRTLHSGQGSNGRRYSRMCRSLWHGHPGHGGNGRDARATFRFSRPFATKTPRHQVGLLTRHTGTQPVGRNQLSSRYFVLSWWENPRGAKRRQDAGTPIKASLFDSRCQELFRAYFKKLVAHEAYEKSEPMAPWAP